jgi:protoporphyrinogen oxidase
MSKPTGESKTMRQWLRRSFGPTLCETFFEGFHALYTAGLYKNIAPQDAYKSPLDLKDVLAGTKSESKPVGYDTTFLYPDEGLDVLTRRMAAKCDMRYGHRVSAIDTTDRIVRFTNGKSIRYGKLISTLPLDKTITMAGLCVDFNADPYTSLMALNIGATRGPNCPLEQWVYVPESKSGFHRVGFYNHVSPAFLPKSKRADGKHVSLYVERAYPGGGRPDAVHTEQFIAGAIAELRDWGWIDEIDVVDPTWVDSAYTWTWPSSVWRESAIMTLESHGIATVGRYGRWAFQGIADSIRDGLRLGATMKKK